MVIAMGIEDRTSGEDRIREVFESALTLDPIGTTDLSFVTVQRPGYIVLDESITISGQTFRAGVYYCGFARGDSSQLIERFICGPLYVDAVTHDRSNNNFGRLLRFRNSLGHWREWSMPMELLRGSGDELRGELLAMGLELDAYEAKKHLGAYLQDKTPERRVTCALQVGWHGDCFVLPDTVIGPNASNFTFQNATRGADAFTVAGTFEDWRRDVGSLASGNPLLIFSLSAAFAGPLLELCHGEGGGFHLYGDSSTGKSTALEAASSVWGGVGYKRSWRATSNGMEGAAMLFNDALLVLDEISECDPREVGQIVYALGNGLGKQRAGRTGSARSVSRWRCSVLSSGERMISTAMAEGGYRAKAGQSVRILDIPVARQYGLFDDLKGLGSGAALSEAIKKAAQQSYGHAGRQFLERLTRSDRNLSDRLNRIKVLPEFSIGRSGQEKRAINRFAVIALAGELATEYGITGWREGEAVFAAAATFALWLGTRGSSGNSEENQILEQLRDFIERHGSARFESLDRTVSTVMVRDRAGWAKYSDNDTIYYFSSAGLNEATKGFDFKRALECLAIKGVLSKDCDGKKSQSMRINGPPTRVYVVSFAKLVGCLDGSR